MVHAMSETIRAFIAFSLPENVVSSIRRVQEELKTFGFKMRWVPPENIHLTLRFLGDINAADSKAIQAAMEKAAAPYPPIPLVAKGFGVFPGIKRPRVLWVGLSGRLDLLSACHRALEDNLATNGFPSETRPFTGHLTLSRVKGKIDPKKLGDALRRFESFQSESFFADKLILFKSELKPSGAVYSKLLSVSMGTGAG